MQWFEVLIRLARSPEHRLRMTDLAAQTILSPSGLTRAVDRLVEAGLVEREACPTDRRSTYAVLTPEGERRVLKALPSTSPTSRRSSTRLHRRGARDAHRPAATPARRHQPVRRPGEHARGPRRRPAPDGGLLAQAADGRQRPPRGCR